ncbi:MAG: tetraspanin family protein [Alphaproteobacteria bacterium]|nr:tetraspanin family protein [Alphaproteobacteria bacterium]
MTPAIKIQILGWLHVLVGGIGIAFGLILLALAVQTTGRGSNAGIVIVPLVLFFGAVFFIPAFVGGVGILRRWPSARGLLIALCVIELLAVPVGTIIGAFGLWVLFNGEVRRMLAAGRTNDESQASHSVVPRFIADRSGVLLAIAGVGAAFIVAIGVGFKISGDPAPAEITAMFYPALIALPLIVVAAVRVVIAQRKREREDGAVPLGVQIDGRGIRRVPFDADRR